MFSRVNDQSSNTYKLNISRHQSSSLTPSTTSKICYSIYGIKDTSEYCYSCKFKIIRKTNNTITQSLPPELINMICSFR